uniref:F5/8 type C domain-containing protein n=1 Tax=Macrostomum lignano TaxID=282301 RepID=A0A1I8F948_9PLAT
AHPQTRPAQSQPPHAGARQLQQLHQLLRPGPVDRPSAASSSASPAQPPSKTACSAAGRGAVRSQPAAGQPRLPDCCSSSRTPRELPDRRAVTRGGRWDPRAGAEVWKAVDIDSVIESRRLNITHEFSNSSSGRDGSIQQLTVELTGCYRIEARGAAGGSNSFAGTAGGSGASMSGRFQPDCRRPAVGFGRSGRRTGRRRQLRRRRRRGGSFRVRRRPPSGRRGRRHFRSVRPHGSDSASYIDNAGFGGANGDPGFNDPSRTPRNSHHGGCGAGWLGGPINQRRSTDDGDGGGGPREGWTGGLAGSGNTGVGGFGGGGGAGGSNGGRQGAAGAGGGFSGGGAGLGRNHAGGGGGSTCDSLDCSGVTGGDSGSQQGRVVVQLVPGLPGTICTTTRPCWLPQLPPVTPLQSKPSQAEPPPLRRDSGRDPRRPPLKPPPAPAAPRRPPPLPELARPPVHAAFGGAGTAVSVISAQSLIYWLAPASRAPQPPWWLFPGSCWGR